MTDTGQVPGEGQPESAGMVEQPGVPAHGAYTYLSESPAEDEDLLLPGAQGAWGNEVPPPAPEPVVEALHEPGPHETAGRDSGSVDLSGVRLPSPTPASVPPSPILSAPHDPAVAPQPQRRPLHLGPPIPDASASPVRSLADRGPAGAPVRQPGPAAPGPEYLDAQPLRDMAPQTAAPWGAVPTAVAQVGAEAPAAETVSPAGRPEFTAEATDAAQAAMTRLAAQASAPVPGEEMQAPAQVPGGVHAHDGVQPVYGHDGVYAVAAGQGAGSAPASAEAGQGLQPPAAVGVPGPEGVAAEAAVPPAEGGTAAEGVVPAPEVAQVPAAEGTVVAETGQVAPVADAAEQSAPVPAPEGASFAEVTEGVQVSEAVQPSEGVQPAAGEQTAEGPAPAVAGTTAEGADAGVAHGPAEGGDAVAAEAVPHAAHAVPLDADAVVAHAVAAQAVPPAVGTVAVEHVVEPAETAEAAGFAAAQADHPHVSGTAAAQPVAADVVAAQAAEATEPEQIHVADPAQAPGTDPAQVTEPPQAPEPAPAAVEPVATAHGTEGEAVALPEPDASPESAVSPEPDAVQVPPGPAAEMPEQALLQVQGPQLAGAVPYDGEAETAAPGLPEPAAHAQDAPGQGEGVPAATPVPAPAGPQLQSAPAAPFVPDGVPGQRTPGATADPLAAGIPPEAFPEQPLGEFVPVDGQVPTTPHLAPTPPQPLVLPAQEQHEPVATVPVPAPREAEPAAAPAAPGDEHAPDVVQHAEDLETRAAEQEESTAAVEEAAPSSGPAAPAYDDVEREAVLKVMRERRDIRNGFRSDPIPHEVLLRVLEAAHTAPSVGHSQPWDFVVIRSAETRRAMHELAMRQRDAYAKSLPKGRAKQFKELKIEAILDTPVNIVVTADPTRGGRHTLGRHTQPQMAPYSSALAVENLWLAARAEGLGVGWVSFFDEREMVRALGLPEHLEVVAYLCVGYVDEFPDEPELMQAGWSKRRPLSWVVHEETYGRRALPGEEPHDLLAETVAQIRPLDAKALGEAWERQKRMTKPAGALGMLEIISAQLSGLSRQCPPPIPEPAAVAIFAGDHGVHAQGVTPWPQEVTAQMVANFLGGGAVCNAFATQVGAEVCVVDVGVAADLPATPGLLPRKIRGGTSDMTTGPAMTREEVKAAIEVGIETARDLVAAGNKALLTGEMGIANTTASAALISVFTGADPAEVTGRGTGINDETLARKTEVVRRALELHQPDPADPVGVLAAIGGFEHAAMVGLLLGGASLRTPVILDGVSAGAAALVARAIAPEVLAACIAGHRSAEPGHVAALNKLGLRPLVDLDLRLGEGTGALLALPLVQSTARAMHEVATFDSAGVTEK
ncbi:nicotinate-nucleotide--dimethylbenzimidazole phosphoribosyltransferase [Streptomyces sp. NPDC005728]|uniref:nicotinate-nucleotide--dimethylbenzimidazole phosphoribosyltransferase n=1 Tax=Streptomyces sp. NPDC005728 TaxID=3157054 RepID=UPI0033D2C586